VRFAGQQRKPHQLLVELTPMIDVVFLLIIFFLTTARFAQITRADVDLPLEVGEQHELPEEAGIVINIDRDGKIIVGGNEVVLEELELIVQDEAAALPPDAGDVKLLIRADRNASSDRLNDVVERLQQIGVGLARLATEVPR
jgi:biopolymer transport protein ExbD